MGTRWTRSWTASVLVAGMAGAAALPSLPLAAPAGAGAGAVAVIVDGTSSELAAAAVRAAGGEVVAPLDLIGGVAATIPAAAAAALSEAGFLVVPDASVSPADHAVTSGPDVAHQVEALQRGTSGGHDAGAGVTVGLIDTGVHPHDDLGKVTAGVDLSDGPEGSLVDGYGHGTFMAGLIAGARTGSAPGAEIVSIKVADELGDTTLHTLIEAIGWAVVHQDEYGIDILNLSFGTNTRLPAPADPLVQAVEAAWASGLLVVTASGNDGPEVLTSPGTSPSALTVGATDHRKTTATADDAVSAWSGRSRDGSKPELVAPGTSLVSLLAPGSFIAGANPGSVVGDGYFIGSGTSMATALASGAAAIVLAHHPEATPGDVKSALVDTATLLSAGDARTIDLAAAVSTTSTGSADVVGRGRSGATARPGTTVSNGWEGARWTGARWTGARWTGARWTEAEWADQSWAGARWTGARWTGARWTDEEWAGARWTGARWTGARWTGARWTMADVEGGEQP